MIMNEEVATKWAAHEVVIARLEGEINALVKRMSEEISTFAAECSPVKVGDEVVAKVGNSTRLCRVTHVAPEHSDAWHTATKPELANVFPAWCKDGDMGVAPSLPAWILSLDVLRKNGAVSAHNRSEVKRTMQPSASGEYLWRGRWVIHEVDRG